METKDLDPLIHNESIEKVDSKKKEKPRKRYRKLVITITCVVLVAALIAGIAIFTSTQDVVAESKPADVIEPAPETVEPIIPETEESKPEEDEPVAEVTPEPEPEPVIPEPEPPTEPIIEETTGNVNQSDVELLACVIYQEAGGNGSCDDCRRYVGDIVLNRVNDPRFPNTIHEVLTAPSQYGRFHWTGVVWPSRASYDTEADAVARTYRIAEELLSGQHSELYGNGYVWQAGFTQGSGGFWCCGHYYGY